MPGAVLKRRFSKSRTPLTMRRHRVLLTLATLSLLVFPTSSVRAESCLASSDLDSATRAALTAAAVRYLDLVEKGDTAALRQRAMPSATSDFSVIETTVKENQVALAGAKAAVRPVFCW